MQGPEELDPSTRPGRRSTPVESEVGRPSEFDPVASVFLPAWVVSHANVHRPGVDSSSAAHADLSDVERQPFAEDGTRLVRARTPSSVAVGDEPAGPAISDGLTLERLYARFDAIAKGWAFGDSSGAHRSIVERLTTNRSNAVELGWSNFLVARRGGTGRLELLGSRTAGQTRELVPDQIPWR